jgi:hypothetical protein
MLAPLALVGSLSLLSGCPHDETKLESAQAPHAATRVRYQLGNPLRGARALAPLPPSETLDERDALALDVTIVALAAPLDSALAAVVDSARLVVRDGRNGRALAPSPHALAIARAGAVANPDELRRRALDGPPPGTVLREVHAVLLSGATTVVELYRDAVPESVTTDLDRPAHVRASILLGRSREPDALLVGIEGEDPRSGSELVALEPVPLSSRKSASWAAIVPSPFTEGARSLLFIARVSRGPSGAEPGAATHEEEIALALRSLSAQATEAARVQRPETPPPPIPDLAATRRALEDRSTARRALFVLALATGAKTAEEVSVAVDDQVFAQISSGVAAALVAAVTSGARPGDVGLAVERATLGSCRDILATQDPPEDLGSALERRGGAAFTLLVSFLGELEKAKSLDELEKVLEAQNLALLEDPSPVIRVRAARWLEARRDLCGYSALGSPAERRAALARIKAKKPGGAGP